MLLTFQKNSSIPDKMYLFYGKAYETLFNQHDAVKEQYDRARKSKLQIDEFQDVFSTFCLTTYVAQKTEFTQTEIIKAIRDALKYRSYSADVDDVLFDLEESICLIVNEGNTYFFIHRSFQEYFAAVFLASCAEEDRDKFLDNVAPQNWDQVLPMLFDMAGDQIEASWLPRKLEEFFKAVGPEQGKMSPLEAFWENLIFQRRADQISLVHLTNGAFRGLMSSVGRFYPEAALTGVLKEDGLESYVLEHWDALPFVADEEYEAGGSKIVEREVAISAIPIDVMEACGLIPMVNKAFNSIKRIDRRLAKSRREREGFLDSFLAPVPSKLS